MQLWTLATMVTNRIVTSVITKWVDLNTSCILVTNIELKKVKMDQKHLVCDIKSELPFLATAHALSLIFVWAFHSTNKKLIVFPKITNKSKFWNPIGILHCHSFIDSFRGECKHVVSNMALRKNCIKTNKNKNQFPWEWNCLQYIVTSISDMYWMPTIDGNHIWNPKNMQKELGLYNNLEAKQ
jgi:hypothetical protein